jgi:hypothetical protein
MIILKDIRQSIDHSDVFVVCLFTFDIERNINDLSALHEINCNVEFIDEYVNRTAVIAAE